MVGIPAGDFAMGSPSSERGRFDTEGPLHRVTLKAFALGKYDVTSEQFLAFLRDTAYQPAPCNPILKMTWRSPGDGHAYPPYDIEPRRWPAVCLDWKDANAYIAWLNGKVRKPGADPAKGPYRLPSEAEWEYAARGGTTTTRWWGDEIGSGNANCNGCGSKWDNSELVRRRCAATQSFRALWHSRQCVAVDGGLLASELCGRAQEWQRVGHRRRLQETRAAWRLVGQSADLRARGDAQRRHSRRWRIRLLQPRGLPPGAQSSLRTP